MTIQISELDQILQCRDGESSLDAAKRITRELADAHRALGGPQPKKDEKGEPLKNEKGEPVLETLFETATRIADERLDLELDALVGAKIVPAERDMFAELAKTSRTLFERMIAQRADLGLLNPIITKAAPHESDLRGIDNGEGFARLLDGGGSTRSAPTDLTDFVADEEG